MDTVLSVRNLGFRYGDEIVFSDVCFDVYRGDFVAVIGANGSGKSTLMRIVVGELSPPQGGVSLFGGPCGAFGDWPRIGYLPQRGSAVGGVASPGSGFPMTAKEIVVSNLYSKINRFHFPKREHIEKAMSALDKTGMGKFADRLVTDLSGGQRQRVMLARALVCDPELLLLDEPTTGVDADTIKSFFELLTVLAGSGGMSIMINTHDMARAAQYASRVLCIENGTLVEIGMDQVGEELLHRHKHPEPTGIC